MWVDYGSSWLFNALYIILLPSSSKSEKLSSIWIPLSWTIFVFSLVMSPRLGLRCYLQMFCAISLLLVSKFPWYIREAFVSVAPGNNMSTNLKHIHILLVMCNRTVAHYYILCYLLYVYFYHLLSMVHLCTWNI